MSFKQFLWLIRIFSAIKNHFLKQHSFSDISGGYFETNPTLISFLNSFLHNKKWISVDSFIYKRVFLVKMLINAWQWHASNPYIVLLTRNVSTLESNIRQLLPSFLIATEQRLSSLLLWWHAEKYLELFGINSFKSWHDIDITNSIQMAHFLELIFQEKNANSFKNILRLLINVDMQQDSINYRSVICRYIKRYFKARLVWKKEAALLLHKDQSSLIVYCRQRSFIEQAFICNFWTWLLLLLPDARWVLFLICLLFPLEPLTCKI